MKAHTKSTDTPPLGMMMAYGFLALPLAFAGLPLYIHIPDFYTREMGLGIASAGTILMLLRFLDAVQDPIIGYISDKSAALRRVIMGSGVFVLLMGMGAVLMGAPSFVPVAHWFAGSVALTALGLSMVNINLVMIGSMFSDDETARSRASGLREGFSLIGMLLAGILPAILMLSMPRPDAFEAFYAVFAGILIAGAVLFMFFYKNLSARNWVASDSKKYKPIRVPMKFFTQNSGFLGACFLTHIAASFPAVLFLYFVTDYLGVSEYSGLFLLLYFLSGAVFMPLWLKMARRYSTGRAWLVSIFTALATFIWAFTLKQGDVWQFGVICVLSGAALGADLALPPVMMARRLSEQKRKAYASQAYAILNLIPKIALAIATGTAFLMLEKTGFSPSANNTPDALWTLAALYALIPCLIKAASALIVFNLNNGETHDIQKRSSADGRTYGT